MEQEIMPRNARNKNRMNKVGIYILMFFLGCLVMYGVVYYFPTSITETITKLEKDVTVTDTGLADAVEKIYDAVVVVSTYQKDKYAASGTGFVYSKEGKKYYLLTNYHVIEGGDKVTVTFTDGTVKETEIIGYDQYADIAVLALENDKELDVAELGDSTKMRVGDTSFAVGAPLDSVYSWTVTRGILSGKDRMVEVSLTNSNSNDYVMKVLQTDAAINSGNSGGPLCNANGEVIGITSLKLVSNGVEGMGFAIPIETAVAKAKQIIAGELTDQPYLGISMVDITQAYYIPQYYRIIQDSGLTSGVIVSAVEKGSAAEKAGIEAGDIITAIEGEKATNIAYLRYYLYQHNIGDKIKITVQREKTEKTFEVTLQSNKKTS